MKTLSGLLILFIGLIGFTAFKTNDATGIYMTRTGQISFFSETSMENIDAHNNAVASALNTKTGDMEFSVLMKSFEFKKALMQEHFNEKYVESDKFPKTSFKGKIANLSAVNFSKDGTYKAEVEGDLTMHGVTKKVKEPGTFTVKGGQIDATSTFNVKLKDYNVIVPSMVKEKISEDIKITVNMNYLPKK